MPASLCCLLSSSMCSWSMAISFFWSLQSFVVCWLLLVAALWHFVVPLNIKNLSKKLFDKSLYLLRAPVDGSLQVRAGELIQHLSWRCEAMYIWVEMTNIFCSLSFYKGWCLLYFVFSEDFYLLPENCQTNLPKLWLIDLDTVIFHLRTNLKISNEDRGNMQPKNAL